MTTRLMYAPMIPVENMRENEPEKAQAYDVTRAILSRRVHELERIVNADNVDARVHGYWTALMYSVHKNRLPSVDYILRIGGDVNQIDQKSRSVYHMIAQKGRNEILDHILNTVRERGETPMVNLRDQYGNTPLLVASSKGHDDILQMLLDNGADIHMKDTKKSRSPLYLAASKGHVRAVEVLMNHGDPQDIDEQDDDGATALIGACANSHVEVIQSLFQNRRGPPPDCNILDADGWTALMWAVHRGHTKVIQCLLLQTPEPDLWILSHDEKSIMEIAPKRYRRKDDYLVIGESLHTMVVSTILGNSLFPLAPEEVVRVIAVFTY